MNSSDNTQPVFFIVCFRLDLNIRDNVQMLLCSNTVRIHSECLLSLTER